MKKITPILTALIAFLFLAGSALATPVYTGDTYAAWGEGGLPTLPTPTGYYIWSNDPLRTSWSVRWTGNNDGGSSDWETWVGSVEFVGIDMDTLTAIAWDTHDAAPPTYYPETLSGIEYLEYSALAGWHWDGFDFTIATSASGRLRFNLGGSYYSDLTLDDSDPGISAYAMWIGNGKSMNVNVSKTASGIIFQSFETPAPVPEPGTLALLGLGLLGLCGLGYRRKK